MPRRPVPISMRQVDPLSWFTGTSLPVLMAALTVCWLVWGMIADGVSASSPILQVSAALFCITGDLVVFAAARGARRVLTWRSASIAIALSGLGMILSAVGVAGTDFPVQIWWAASGFGLTIGALAPYLPWRTILALGLSGSAVVVAVSFALLVPGIRSWGPVATLVIIAIVPLGAAVMASVFSWYIVDEMQRLLEARSRTVVVADRERGAAAEARERERVAALTSRAVPFLEGVIARGTVDQEDRRLAGQLARRLRDDLVTQSTATWLDSLDAGPRLVVVDPDHLADRLGRPQQTVLRGMIRGLLSTPGIDRESLLLELRRDEDGSTAVGISMDAELPEGRRIVHLRPYLLTLEMTAGDVSVVNQDFLRMTFAFRQEG